MTTGSRIPIAIIGMACRLPGADNLEQFWKLVVEGRTAVAELPPDRLDRSLYYDPKVGVLGKSYSQLGAIINSRDFDRDACPIPAALENSVDNAHLLMCGVTADALRHAGLDPFNVPLRNTGVYIGHAQGSTLGGDYTYATYAQEAAEMLREVPGFADLSSTEQDAVVADLVARIREPLPVRTPDSPDVACSLVAGVISKAFGLTGPFLALNSACASSLQAMLVAARALQLGRVDMAIAGGASDCKSDSLVLFANARAMSSTGSRPFDAEADGLVIGEGYVALVMKTLERALADGDPIHAVVRGLGVSSDGKGKSLWAPRKEGQMLAMQRAYRDGLDFADLDYVEAHATATQLGDATELNTLADVLKGKLPPGKKVPITSVKANIGHTLETAGIAGVIKTVLALKHNTIPPAASVRELNPKINWDEVPVYVPLQPQAWQPHADGRPRRAGVNAFGIGGLNMHVAVEEFNEASRKLVPALPPRTSDDDAIAVIGTGCVWPGAHGVDEYWQLLASGRDPKSDVTPDRWRADLAYKPGSQSAFYSPTKRGGFITGFEYDWKTHKIPPKQVQQADPLQFMLLEAADQSIKQSGYDQRPFDRARVGVVVGTEFGGDFAFQLQLGLRLPEMERRLAELLARRGQSAAKIAEIQKGFSKTLLRHWPSLIDETGSFSTSSLASRIAKTWNLMGGAAAIDCGHCSSLAALAVSIDMLLTGDCDMMLCAAGQRRLGLPEYEALAINGVLAEDGASPLDRNARGYLPAEGVGVVLLKRLADARRDGDKILAVIRGAGAAHHDSPAAALEMAIGRSLTAAGRSAADIGILEVDGALAVESGAEQIGALEKAYAAENRAQPVLVSSVVGQIGHAEAAAGMASLLKAEMEIERGVIPKTAGLVEPRIGAGSTLAVVARETPVADEQKVAAVVSRSRSLTYHAILESPNYVPKTAAARPAGAAVQTVDIRRAEPIASPAGAVKIFRFAGADQTSLTTALAQARGNLAGLFAAGGPPAFDPRDAQRAAIVADSADALAAKLDAAIKQAGTPAAQAVLRQQGIFINGKPAERPQVVFCFPGQGSQYHGMLRELVEQLPEVAAAHREVEATLERYGYQSFASLAWENSPALGTQVWPTQLAVLCANHLMHRAVQTLGVNPDAALGHSFGEYSALSAAGAFDFETAVQLTRARCDGIAGARVQGGLVAVSASADRVAELARGSGIAVYVANYNAPDQTVVGGDPAALTAFQQALTAQKISFKPLAVPAPFHTPLMKPAAAPLERFLAGADVAAPRTPVWSVVTNRPVSGADEIRANLVAHLTSPVMYVDLIRAVSQARPTVLVEVGPGQVLTNLNRRIVDAERTVLVACDQAKRPGLEQLLAAKALLETLGMFDREPAPATASGHVATAVATEKPRHTLLVFDATARRREKMRQAALSGKGKPSAAPARPATPGVNGANGAPPVTAPVTPPIAAKAPSGNGVVTPVAASVPQPAAPPKPAAQPGVDLEKFLINFVVEQTGYPPEVVELDADLEADLGIDSIKKAQLFGELQEYFDVVATDDLTLDAFPTLRHVLDFLRSVPMKGQPAVTRVVATGVRASAVAAVEPAPVADARPATQPGVDLEKFLINFVVEQTGYPPEVVELDADLEADLGIDSIKKAQLFGELQEYFDVVATDDLTLDAFPTLRHVLDFLRRVPMKGQPTVATVAPVVEPVASPPPAGTNGHSASAAATPVAPARSASSVDLEKFLINFVVEQTGYPPEVVELDADLEADLGIDSIKKAQLFGELQEYFDVVATDDLTLDAFPTLRHVLDFLRSVPMKGQPVGSSALSAPTPTVVAQPVAPAPQRIEREPAVAVAVSVDADELEQFLINFVVEQTGYPPEVVELDADLEADLGIDSIKKAQLFGELQEYFDVVATDDLTLDAFPTLRHVLDFLRSVPRKGQQPVRASAPVATREVVARDATASIGDAPSAVAVAEPIAPSVDADELEQFLVNFVVEQTGYPPEVVELDADLEADLGIDSIKKAQLFGELQEYFDVVATDDLTLDAFPTLRHVLDFLRNVPRKGATVAKASPAESNGVAQNGRYDHESNGHGDANGYAAHHPVESPVSAAIEVVTGPTPDAEVTPALVELSGTPYEMGVEHGRRFRRQIRTILRLYADLPDEAFSRSPLLGANTLDPQRLFTGEELDELQGIADGAEVPLGNIVAHNIAALNDLGELNLQFAAPGAEPSERLQAGAWSPPLPIALKSTVQPAVFVRQGVFGLRHAAVSLIGTIGAIAGVNTAGVVVTAAPRPASASNPLPAWPRLVARLLERQSESSDLASAVDAAQAAGVLVSQATRETAIRLEADGATVASEARVGPFLVAGPSRSTMSSFDRAESSLRAIAARGSATAAEVREALESASVGEPERLLSVVIDAGASEIWIGRIGGEDNSDPAPVKLPDFAIAAPAAPQPVPAAKAPEAPSAPQPQSQADAAWAAEFDFSVPADPYATLRFTLQTVPAELPADVPATPALSGAAIVVGDNPVADELQRQIAALGAPVHRVRTLSGTSADQDLVRGFWSAGPAPHLFLASAYDEQPGDLWQSRFFFERYRTQVLAPFYFVQAWITAAVEHKAVDQCSVVALVNLGGDFAFAGGNDSPVSGALTGLVKALCLEMNVMRAHKKFLAKAIDAAPQEPAPSLVASVLRELASGAIDYEVAYKAGRRHLQGGVRRPVRELPGDLRPAGTWIVTGGARGITAECALELGRRYGLKLHLIGSSPIPQVDPAWRALDEAGLAALKSQVMVESTKRGQKPADAWEPINKALEIDRNLAAFAAAGVDVTYHACDVSDRASLARVLEAARQDGPITGILHGAGIERSCRFEKKTQASVEATLGAKVLGAYHLMELTRQDPIRHFLGFGSISGRLGSNGQADYCVASDMLAKLTGWHHGQRPECRAVTFHWHPWDEVGMAYRPETQATLKMTNGPTLMPKREGLAHLVRELELDTADTEVLITSREYFERYYGPDSVANNVVRQPSPPLARGEQAKALSADESVDVASRYVLALEPAPPASARVAISGSACVLGDNADAQALAGALRRVGVATEIVAVGDNEDELYARLDQLWATEPPAHLILMTARDAEAVALDSREAMLRRRSRGVLAPYFVAQRWLKRLAKSSPAGPLNLVAVTNMGGDFAIGSTHYAPESGALAGLVKSVHVEGSRRKGAKIASKVIDFAADAPSEDIARAVLDELSTATTDVEIAYQNGARYVVRVVPAAPVATSTPIQRGGVWVVTGGARGITAAAARALAQRHGLKLHLVGASPKPDPAAPWIGASDEDLKRIKAEIVSAAVAAGRSPEEDWLRVKKDREITESLDKFRAAGVATTYHSCDVSDWDALGRVLDEIRRDGPIAGVVHGAGWAKSARLEMKSRPIVERSLAPKFEGALGLMLLTRQDPVKHFVTFGSISGRYGGNGLSDYAAANEGLAKLAGWYRGQRPDCAVSCLAWQTWDEIGMATLSDSVPMTKNVLQMKFIPPAEGVRHFEREILAGLPHAEVIITDGYFEKLFYSNEAGTNDAVANEAPANETLAPGEPTVAPGPSIVPAASAPAPLIKSLDRESQPGSVVAAIEFDPQVDPFLTDHRLRNSPFLPGVIALESLAQAAAAAEPGREVVALKNVEIVQGIKFQPGRAETAHVTLTGDGAVRQAALSLEVRNRRGQLVDRARLCCRGEVELGDQRETLSIANPGQPPLGWLPFAYADAALLYHGPKFRYLKQCNYEYEGGWGQIVAPPLEELAGARGTQGWLLPTAVLDACVVACGSFVFLQFAGRLEVPFRFGLLRWSRLPRPGESCTLRLYFRGREERHSTFDFTLFGTAGDAILDVQGYQTVLVAEKAIA